MSDVDVELLELARRGLARCRWCGGTRPLDCWCTCLPWEEQLELLQAEARARGRDAGAGAQAARDAAPTALEILRQVDQLEQQLAGLRAEVEAALATVALERGLAARVEQARAAIVDAAATAVVQVGVMAPAHAASLLGRAAFVVRWWLGWAGVGPYRSDAAAWWVRGGPLGERIRDGRAR